MAFKSLTTRHDPRELKVIKETLDNIDTDIHVRSPEYTYFIVTTEGFNGRFETTEEVRAFLNGLEVGLNRGK